MSLRSDAAEIVFDHVTKRYAGLRRARRSTTCRITIPAGEICVLIGPSGGGKTTAMKMVNRLISITEGDITIDGQSVNALDPTELRRGIGYVIQQIGLFPHMTIEANVAHRAASCSAGTSSAPATRGARAARARRPRPRRVRQALSGAAVRRPAPARRPGAGDGGRPAADADGRAVRRDRPDHARAPAERLPAPAPRDPQDRRLRHARHRRGDQDGRPDLRSCARAASSPSSTRRRRSSPTPPTTSWPTSSAPTAASSGSALRQLDELDARSPVPTARRAARRPAARHDAARRAVADAHRGHLRARGRATTTAAYAAT